MSDDLEISNEVAIQAGIETVWRLLSTAQGRSTWFGTEASIDLVVGGSSHVSWAGEQAIDATVDAIEPGRRLRLAYVVDGEEMGAEEYLLRPDGENTIVRVLQSMARPEGAGDGWDGFRGDLERGWRLFLASLRYAAEQGIDHRHADCAFAPAPEGRRTAWDHTLAILGIPGRAELSTGPVDIECLGPAQVLLADPPHTLLIATPRRSIACDLEGTQDLFRYLQVATHGTHDTASDRTWRAATLNLLRA